MAGKAAVSIILMPSTAFVRRDYDRVEGGMRWRVVCTSPAGRWESRPIESETEAGTACEILKEFVGAR